MTTHPIIRIIGFLFLIHFHLLSTTDSTIARPSISQMADQYGASIVQINTFNEKGDPVGSGTGFFIDDMGSLVTNHHVLERCDRAIIKTESGNKGKITMIIQDDPERDLLIAGTTFKRTLPIPFHPNSGIRIHDDVIYFGNIEKAPNVISMGRVIDIIAVNDFEVIKITAPILPGSSGSPVLNQDGQLIAIATAYLDLDKGHFFALPAEYLQHLKAVNFDIKSLPIRAAELGATVQGKKLIGLGLYMFQQSCLTVYFKNGRHKQCDRAWMEGDTVYLVMQGKEFAIGYPKDEIDMQKSFGY